MKRFFAPFLIAVFLLIAGPSHAGFPAQLQQAIDLYMNADFAQASAKISAYISSNPNDPAGYLVRGMSKDWEQIVLNHQKKFNSAIMSDYQKANDLAKAAYEADKNNLEKQILLGNTYMYLAKKQVDTGSKMTGGNTLKKSKELMLDAIAKNPNAVDANMALGVFNYFSQNVPSGFKWLAALMGFKGDAAKGIQYINKAASSPNLTQGDAKFMQLYIAHKKKSYAQALTYAQGLKSRYPNNPKFLHDVGQYQFRTGNVAASRETFENYFKMCKSIGNCNKENEFLANFFLAWGYMNEKDYKTAKPYVAESVRLNPGRFKDRNVYMDLWQGLIAKSEGKKDVAKTYLEKAAGGSRHSKESANEAKAAIQTL